MKKQFKSFLNRKEKKRKSYHKPFQKPKQSYAELLNEYSAKNNNKHNRKVKRLHFWIDPSKDMSEITAKNDLKYSDPFFRW